MQILDSFLLAAAVIFVYMNVLFIIAVVRRDNSVADIAWGIGFIVAAASVLARYGDWEPRQVIATLLVTVWGLRLAIRIFLRNRGRGEDIRYRKWRENWGKFFLIRSYFQVFMLQGFILLINLSPVIIINTFSRRDLTWTDAAGMAVWCVGFFFEAAGDYQLDQFIADPDNRGKIMDRKLWRYTRHPNYFGEVTMWWALFIMALAVPWGLAGIIGPLVITVMILFVSGVPMTEKLMENDPAFQEYRKRTSVFFPWFPAR